MKSKEELDRAFLRVSTRKVLKDSTIKIFGSLYEVDNPSLVGREVKVSYPIGDVSVLEIKCKGFPPSKAKVLNIGEDIDYEKREKIREEKGKEINIESECGSSLLRAQKNKHLKENPSSSRYSEINKEEEKKEDKKTPITRFSAIGGEKDE